MNKLSSSVECFTPSDIRQVDAHNRHVPRHAEAEI
jgi:hypothetical protein